MIYNFFDVKLEDWFFRLGKSANKKPSKNGGKNANKKPSKNANKKPSKNANKKQSKSADPPIPPSPKASIQASGFVFVNVKYQTEVKLIEEKRTKKQKGINEIIPRIPAVRHDFQSSEQHDDTKYFDKVPQKFGDYFPDEYKHEDPWLTHDLSPSYSNRWVPRTVEFSHDTLGQEYFLMNLPNPKINNPDNVPNANELAAIALSFTDSTSVSNPLVWAGTLVVGNRYTSLRLDSTTWLGGQIILAGGKLELSHTSVLCGKYSANLPCTSAEPITVK